MEKRIIAKFRKALKLRYLLLALLLPFSVQAANLLVAANPSQRDPDISFTALLHDPKTPVWGNPTGDVTIVEFFDYNCPFCMKAEPALEALMADDRGIRLVYKDWPIFGEVSVFAAKLALAAHWQHRYHAVHAALLRVGEHKTSDQQVRDIAQKAGANMDQLDKDMASHATEIQAILARNEKQADKMGFPGTPVFLIGPLLINQAIDLPAFKKAVADARKKLKLNRKL